MPTSLRCVTCASDVPAGARWLCPACDSLLEAVVDLAGAAAVVLVPEATAPGKVAQALACGARVLPVRGTYNETAAAATFKGYGELRALGWVPTVPRIVCVQPEACAPLVRAFTEGLPRVEPVAVSDAAIERAQVLLAEGAGLYAEPAAAASVAAAAALRAAGWLPREALTVCIVTGQGLKQAPPSPPRLPPPVPPHLSALERALAVRGRDLP